jgi:4-amino-4-deoxy-L-arabinose transferase-like glycosyltransferase
MIDHASASPPTARWRPGLLAVVFVAAVLRLWAIDFALDVDRARPDEEFVSGKAVEILESGDLDPHFFHYPSLVLYLNAALLRALEPLVGDDVDPRLVGRMLSALLGVGTVAVVGFLGTRLFSPRAGLASSAFLAIAYEHVRESHFATTDVAFVFFVALSVLLAVEGERRGGRASIRLAAAAAGLAMSSKYPGVLALAPLALVVGTLEGLTLGERARELALDVLLALAVFASTSPFFFLDPEGARASLGELFRETWGEGSLSVWNPWYPIVFSLRYGMGIPLLSLGAMGLAVGARDRRGLLLLAWALPFLGAAMMTPTAFARYSLPVVPPLVLAAAGFLHRLSARTGAPAWIPLALFAAGALPNLSTSLAFDRLLSREDTRSLARQWIQDELAPGTRIQVSSGYGAPRVPPGFPIRRVGPRLAAVREAERDGFGVLVTHEHPALERFSRVDRSLSRRLDSSALLRRFDPFVPGHAPGIYDALDAFYLPYAQFDGVERPGPIVSVWRLSP